MTTTYIPQRALFIYAHADDIEFGVAGTAAVWARHGCQVRYILLTDSSIGSHDLTMTREKLAAIREAEQQASAEIAGAVDCIFLGQPDGQLEATMALRQELVRLIRQYRPNAVVCGDPTQFFPNDNRINHPDHRAAAQVALDAVFPSADSPLLFPELLTAGYAPHKVNYVYISSPSGEPNYYVDISETLPIKIEALRQHRSQLNDWDPAPRLQEWSANVGRKVGFAHAEAFRRITLKEPEAEESVEQKAEATRQNS